MLKVPDYNRIRTNNDLVRKRTLNDLAKLAQYLSCVVRTYLFGALTLILHVTYAFRVSLHSVIDWMSRNSMLKTDITSVSRKDFLDIQAIRVQIHSKHVYGMIKAYNLRFLLLLFEQMKT